MPGGSKESYAALGPILESIVAHVDGEACGTTSAPTPTVGSTGPAPSTLWSGYPSEVEA